MAECRGGIRCPRPQVAGEWVGVPRTTLEVQPASAIAPFAGQAPATSNLRSAAMASGVALPVMYSRTLPVGSKAYSEEE